MTENVTFSSFHCNHCKGSKFFHHKLAACETVPENNGVKHVKAAQKVVAKVYLLPYYEGLIP